MERAHEQRVTEEVARLSELSALWASVDAAAAEAKRQEMEQDEAERREAGKAPAITSNLPLLAMFWVVC